MVVVFNIEVQAGWAKSQVVEKQKKRMSGELFDKYGDSVAQISERDYRIQMEHLVQTKSTDSIGKVEEYEFVS